MLKIALSIASSVIVSSVATYAITDPRIHANAAQEQIIAEYIRTYCETDAVHSTQWHLGTAAILSRVAIKSGLGAIVMAELTKCRVGLK